MSKSWKNSVSWRIAQQMATASYCLTRRTVLILLLIFLIRLFNNYMKSFIGKGVVVDIGTPYLFVFYLIVGFFADFKCGKLKIALVSAVFCFLTSFLKILGNVLAYFCY